MDEDTRPVYPGLIAWGVVLVVVGGMLTTIGLLGVDSGAFMALSYPFVAFGIIMLNAGLIGYAVNGRRVRR